MMTGRTPISITKDLACSALLLVGILFLFFALIPWAIGEWLGAKIGLVKR